MSVPVHAQYNESWSKKSLEPAAAAAAADCSFENRIPSRPHSAAIHFDDHSEDKETETKNRRHSLSPNFIVNENNRLVR